MGLAALARLPPSRDAYHDDIDSVFSEILDFVLSEIFDPVFSELLDKAIGSDYILNTPFCKFISPDFITARAGYTRTSFKEGSG